MIRLVVAFLAATLTSWGAQAQSIYSATTIVDMFQPTIEAALQAKARGLDAKRGLCIGTGAACPTVEFPAIQFAFDSDVLTAVAREQLVQLATAMTDLRFANAPMHVDGHTDAVGSEQYNLGLSERRARSVVAYLVSLGIDPKRLLARGLGKSKPKANTDPFDAANRRVELGVLIQ